ncbi:MAG: transposase, partial [Verrucomicrobiota bacterium]
GRPQILTDATAHYHKIYRWYAHLFLVMPDHIHGLFSFPPDRASMSQTIASWKSYTAKRAGFSWQRDYFNHRLRTDESFDEKAHYIRMNPVRARLADSPDTWPHAWSPPNPR